MTLSNTVSRVLPPESQQSEAVHGRLLVQNFVAGDPIKAIIANAMDCPGKPCTANHRFPSEFNFPITVGESCPASMRSLGSKLPLSSTRTKDPLDDPRIQQLLEIHEAKTHEPHPIKWDIVEHLVAKNPNPVIFSKVQEEMLMRIPFNPSLLIENPPKPSTQVVK